MEPRELIYNVYKNIVSIKNSFDDTNLWCNPYKTIPGLTPMTPGYVISMGYTPHIDIEEYLSEEFIEKLLISKGSMSEIEQLKGKELLDTLEALRTILHPTVRALLESYTIDMVMPIPGIISFLLIGKSKQGINSDTIISCIRYLMEGCIDHEPTPLIKEYHIHLNTQPKEGQENPSIIQIMLISKKLTTITIK
jgi:hypothetical protein